MSTLVGVISDTHALLRPQAIDALAGCDLIVHAGDVGSPQVLDALEGIAPVHAVRGNVDKGAWATRLPETELLEVGGASLFVLHDLATLDLDPEAAGIDVVISGHSHQPRIERKRSVLYFNPGSAGPRRFTLPISMGCLHIGPGGIEAKHVHL